MSLTPQARSVGPEVDPPSGAARHPGDEGDFAVAQCSGANAGRRHLSVHDLLERLPKHWPGQWNEFKKSPHSPEVPAEPAPDPPTIPTPAVQEPAPAKHPEPWKRRTEAAPWIDLLRPATAPPASPGSASREHAMAPSSHTPDGPVPLRRRGQFTSAFWKNPNRRSADAPAAPPHSLRKYGWWLGLPATGLAITLVLWVAGSILPPRTASTPAPPLARPAGTDELASVVSRFFDAALPAEKARFICGGGAMLPAMQQWYAVHPDEPSGFSLADPAAPLDHGAFVRVKGIDGRENPVLALAEHSSNGAWLLDWRSLTGAGDMEWRSWLEQRPAEPVTLRVLASLDDFYPAPFDDKKKYLCLKLTRPDEDAAAWACVDRSLAGAGTLLQLLTPPPATAEAPFPAERRRIRVQLRMTGVFAFPQPSPTSATTTMPAAQLLSITSTSWRDDSPEAGAKSASPADSSASHSVSAPPPSRLGDISCAKNPE